MKIRNVKLGFEKSGNVKTINQFPSHLYANDKKYTKGPTLGSGGYGAVALYKNSTQGEIILKKFSRQDSSNHEEKLIKLLISEKKINCGVVEIKSHVHRFPNGREKIYSLMPRLAPILQIKMTHNQKTQCFLSVIKQIECLARYGLYYYDIKPENVLSSLNNLIPILTQKRASKSKKKKKKREKIYTLKEAESYFRSNQFLLGDLGSIWSRHLSRGGPVRTYHFIGSDLKNTSHKIHVKNVKILCIVFLLDLFKIYDKVDKITKSKTRTEQFENLSGGLDELYYDLGGVMGYVNNKLKPMTRQKKLKFIRNLKHWVNVPVPLTPNYEEFIKRL